MGETVLVTGVAGFIGSHLARRLLAEGLQVRGLDDLSEGSLDNICDLPEVEFMEADIRDEHSVIDAGRGCQVIFHQAAKRSVPRSLAEPELFIDVNLRGTLNVLLAARDAGARVVSASSSSVYGDQEMLPLSEAMVPAPKSPYAATKLSGEILCAMAWRAYRVPAISLRYFNAFGPHQDPASEYAAVIPRFAVACLTGQRPTVHGNGAQGRDFTFIDDVVNANVLASRAGERAFGLAMNVGGGAPPVSISQLLLMIASLCETDVDPIREPARQGDIRLSHADVSLAGEAIGFVPKVPLLEGLTKTVDWFKSKLVR
jgi:nucleoside-diphosphate-sugar epimerase